MNPLWLILIIPASVFFGYMAAALMFLAKQADEAFESINQ